MATEVGHISGLLAATEVEKTPLTRQLDKLTGQIVIIAGLALVASIAIGLWRGQPADVLFITAIAFSVAAIPTGLPAVVTTLLSIGHDGARQGRRDRQAVALRRDAGRDVGHQLRQDRHAHAEPDDGGRAGHPGPALHRGRPGLRDRSARSTASMAPPRPLDAVPPGHGPGRGRRGPGRRTGGRSDRGRPGGPRRQGRHRPGSHPRDATRASRSSRSTRRTSSWRPSTA